MPVYESVNDPCAPGLDPREATPSDVDSDANHRLDTRVIMVAVAGNVSVSYKKGMPAVSIPALQPGIMYGIPCERIWATNTTATGLVTFR